MARLMLPGTLVNSRPAILTSRNDTKIQMRRVNARLEDVREKIDDISTIDDIPCKLDVESPVVRIST
jgi:hypothetical protein